MFNNHVKVGLGGTFLRLFPAKILLNAIHESETKNHIPIIYMHSYEFINGADFWVSWKKFNRIDILERLYTWARQIQWTRYGHKGVEKKLSRIFTEYDHQGTMKSLID